MGVEMRIHILNVEWNRVYSPPIEALAFIGGFLFPFLTSEGKKWD